MKPRFRSLIAAFAPLSRTSLIVVASLCAATNADAANQTWSGATSDNWNNAGNWTSAIPTSSDLAIFDASSTLNLATLVGINSQVAGLRVVEPSGPVSIGTAVANNLPTTAVAVTPDSGTDVFTYAPATPLVNGDRVTFTATTLPGGMTAGATYFVINATSTSFQISTTAGGGAFNFTSNGAGVVVNGVVLADSATDVLTQSSAFKIPLANGDIVYLAAQTAPTGLGMGQPYHVVGAGASTFQVALARGGAPVDFTANGLSLRILSANNAPRIGIGASGIDMSAATGQNLTISNGIDLDANQSWNVAAGRTVSVTSAAYSAGPGSLTASGAGTVAFSGHLSTAGTGIAITGGGTVSVAALAADDNLGTLSYTGSGGTFSTTTIANSRSVVAPNLFVAAGVTGNYNAGAGRCNIAGGGAATGTGIFRLTVGASATANTTDSRHDINGNWTAFNGNLQLVGTTTTSGVRLVANGGNFNSDMAATKVSLSAETDVPGKIMSLLNRFFTNGTTSIGALEGTSSTFIKTAAGSGAGTYSIGALNLDTEFAGTITNGTSGLSITKVGSGILTLSGTANDHTGATTVNGGTLKYNGAKTGTGATTVNLDATLAGTGSLAGTTTVASGGHLSPGDSLVASGVGTITHSNLTLATGGILDLEFGAGVNDKVTVASGGTLTLNAGVKINVFDGTVAGGVSFGTNGTYPIINVAGVTVSGFNSSTFVVENAVPGKVYSFTNDGTVIALVVSDNDPSNYWTIDGGGLWNTAANWTKNLVPNAPGANAKIGPGPGGLGFFGASVPIDLNTVQTVGEIVFNLDSFDYNISINPGTAGSLLMDNNTAPSNIVLVKGDHFIAAPIAIDAQGLAIDVADIPAVPPAEPTPFNLNVSGVISGTGASLLKSGPGTLVLTGDNTYDGGTSLNGGRARINSLTSLGATTAAVTFAGGTLQLANDLAADSRPIKVSGSNNAIIDTNGFNYGYAGSISPQGGGTGGLQKLSTGTMTISSTHSYTGTTSLGKALPTDPVTYMAGGVLEIVAGGNISGGAVVVNPGNSKVHVNGGSLTPGGLVTVTSSVLEVSGGSAVLNSGLNGNTGNPSTNIFLNLTGGTFSSSFVSMGRCAPIINDPLLNGGSTTAGLYVNGAAATISGLLNVGLNSTSTNSTASARIDSGSLTVGGPVLISIASPDRWSVLDVNGGTFTSTDAVTGIQIGSGQTGSEAFLVRGTGVAKAERILLQQPAASTETSLLSLSGGALYVGAGGIVGNNNAGTGVLDIQLGAVAPATAVLGAKADWSTLLGATLLTDTTSTIKAADDADLAHDITISGVVTGSGGLVKTGAGKLTLGGTNTYTGTTTVTAGTLAVTGDSSAATGAISVASGATLGGNGKLGGDVTIVSGAHHSLAVGATPATQTTRVITGTLNLESGNILDLTAAAAPAAGTYELVTATSIVGTPTNVNLLGGFSGTVEVVGGNKLVLTVTGGGYASWKVANAGGQDPSFDFDSDGVSNGVEYFMNAPAGFTANPGLDGSKKVTWTNGGNIPFGDYGSQFVVQTSDNLATWTPVLAGDSNLQNVAGSVSYTLTGTGKRFVRLVVTPN